MNPTWNRWFIAQLYGEHGHQLRKGVGCPVSTPSVFRLSLTRLGDEPVPIIGRRAQLDSLLLLNQQQRHRFFVAPSVVEALDQLPA